MNFNSWPKTQSQKAMPCFSELHPRSHPLETCTLFQNQPSCDEGWWWWWWGGWDTDLKGAIQNTSGVKRQLRAETQKGQRAPQPNIQSRRQSWTLPRPGAKRSLRHRWCSDRDRGTAPSASTGGPRTLNRSEETTVVSERLNQSRLILGIRWIHFPVGD